MTDFLVRFGLMVLVVAGLIGSCVSDLQSVDASGIAWALGFLLTCLSPLFAPLSASAAATLPKAVTWSFAVAALALLAPVTAGFAAPASAAALAVVVWLASLALQLLLACAHSLARTADPNVARVTITAVFAALSAAPLWLGHAAQLLGSQSGWPSRIVALSPAAHLGSAIDCDLLRLTWFYANTPIGGLRFDYPQFGSIVLSYTVATVLLLVCVQWVARRPGAKVLDLQFARS